MAITLDDFDFELPAELVAQRPAPRRADARLLAWRQDGTFDHLRFTGIAGLFRPGDLLVLNDTRVFAARIFGRKRPSGARVEILLVRPGAEAWEALVRPGRRLSPGTGVDLDGGGEMEVGEPIDDGLREVQFPPGFDVLAHCARHGHVPLPPYIRRADDPVDRERYQTVFARTEGSVAAPTAGLHFDEERLAAIRERGVEVARVTLHVGPGTFRPVEERQLERGELHPEWREVSEDALGALRRCRERGGRIVAVGTTVCRTLESIPEGQRVAVSGPTRLLITPGFRFRYTDVLLTNFHLPRSSLLLLVAAFAGPRWERAYALAVRERYRFYSYGDANWIEGTP